MTGVTILPGTRIFRSHDSRAKINHPGTPLCRHRVISHARAAPTNAGQPLGATMSSTLSPARKVPRDSILEDGTEVDDGDEWSGESESGNTIRAQVAVPNRSATLSPVSGLPRTWHTSRKGGAGNTGAYARSMRSQDHMHVLARHLERSDPYVLVVAGRQDAADLAVELGHSLGWATLCAEDIDPYDESSTDRVLARQVRRQIVCRNSCIVQAPLQDAWLYRKCLATSQDNGARLVIVCVGDRSVPSWAPSEDTLAHVRSLDNIEAEIDPDTFDQEVGELTRTGAELNRGPDAHWAWLLELEEGMEEEDACEFVIDAMWDIDSWLGSVDVAE